MWSPQARSEEARAIYAAAEADRRDRPEKYLLDANAVVAAVEARGGFVAEDDGDWREGLEVYLEAAREEGRLNALGLRNVAGTATGKLLARQAIAAALQASPAVRERHVDRPLFVIGGWRTGTTLLQRLLAAVPALRAAYPAELTVPWRFAGLDEAARERLIAAGEDAHQRLHVLNPRMSIIHPSGGRLPEECVLAMGTDLKNWGLTSTLRCPSYARWLLTQDFEPSYRRYADILRLLQDDSGRRWILKAPAHTAALDSLLAVFPDATVVHLHREVVQTVTSGASLFAEFRSIYSDEVDGADVGRYQLETTVTWFDRAMAARDAHPGARLVDVAYPRLAADPLAIIREVCNAADVPWDEATAAATRARLAELRAQHGVHRYQPEDFGLDPGEVRERFSVYRQRFEVS
ncbi:MAG: sulfotransferase [Pseudomonadales bacterium]